jgi:tetratricopeptide (TPR) repeat protein
VTRATSIRKTLLEQSPDDGIRHTELVESYLLMGDVHRQLRELKSAEGAYRLAENSQERLIQRKPNNRASQFLLVTCESRLGDVHWLKDEIDDALAVFTQVNQKLSKLAYKLQGTSDFDLLRSHALFKIAEAHYLRAEPAAAWTAVDESLQHIQRCVAQHPDLLQPRMHLGHVQMTAGQIQDMLHDWPAAVWAYEQAIETKQDLLQRVPDKVGATRDQANVYWLLGRARERTGDRRSALAAFKESRVRYRELFLNADGDGELFRLARQGSNSVWRVWMLNWTGRCFMSLVIAGLFVATAVLFMWGQSWWPIGFLPGMAGLLLTITFVGNNVWGYYDLRRAQRELVEASKTGASSND